MRLLKFAILLCLSMMFATSYAQMAVKETDKRKAAIDVFDDKDFELAVGYNDYVVSQPGKDTGWASYSFCARGKIKELDCSLPLSLEAGLLMSYFNGDYNNEDNNRFGEYSMRMFSLGVPYCHPAYLIDIESTSCEMLGWMKHKWESRFPGEIPIISETQMTPPLRQKTKRN